MNASRRPNYRDFRVMKGGHFATSPENLRRAPRDSASQKCAEPVPRRILREVESSLARATL